MRIFILVQIFFWGGGSRLGVCLAVEGTVSTSSGQGHPRLGLVKRLGTPPPPRQSPWERKLLKVRWSGAGGGREEEEAW